MGIVLTSFGRALLAPPFRLRRDTIPPHDPSGPFADHPCVRFTRASDNDSVTRPWKSADSGIGHLFTSGTLYTLGCPSPGSTVCPSIVRKMSQCPHIVG